MAIHDDPSANGNAETFDPEHPDIAALAGVVARVDSELQTFKIEQARQGRLLDRVAQALGVEVEKSDPPPNYRAKLDSHQEEIKELQRARDEERAALEALRKVDADTSQNIAAVNIELAEQKTIVRSKIIEGIPLLAKQIGALVLALTTIGLLFSQVWAAIHGH